MAGKKGNSNLKHSSTKKKILFLLSACHTAYKMKASYFK